MIFENPGELGEQLSRLNRITAGNCPRNCFVTFCVVMLDHANGELHYCNAGHNPPLLLHASGEVEPLPATGLVLGIFPSAIYEEKTCRFDRDDLLLLFSDGVTEACRPDADEEFGEERLVDLMRKHHGQPAAAIVDAIRAEVALFTGNAPPADDITLVAARRL